jgi:hypothetical protein
VSLRPIYFLKPLRFIKSNLTGKSSHCDVLRKKYFLVDFWNFSEILPSLKTEAVEDRDVTFDQSKGSYVKHPLLRMPKPPSNQI